MGLQEITHVTAEVFEALGVTILAIGIAIGVIQLLRTRFTKKTASKAVAEFRVQIGQTMLLGLEVLIAADIVKTVAVDVTLVNMSALGLLVAVRTFLSWSLELEIDGCWPWQKR